MFAHHGRRRFGAQERSRQIDRQHPTPVLIRGLQQRRKHRDPGIVDQRIEAAEAAVHAGHRCRDRGGVGDVAMQRQRRVRLGQRSHRAVKQFALDIEQRHPAVLGEKASCDRQSDAARGAGYQRDLLRQGRHGQSIGQRSRSLAWKCAAFTFACSQRTSQMPPAFVRRRRGPSSVCVWRRDDSRAVHP
jgi:hypothetical protein